MKRSDYLILSFSITGIIFCILLSYIFINKESTFILAVFNLLFITLTFPLDGKLIYKTCLLLLGNIVGAFLNYFFLLFTFLGIYCLGEFFNIICAILNPFANLVWIVSFWSISLAFLANSKKEGKDKI